MRASPSGEEFQDISVPYDDAFGQSQDFILRLFHHIGALRRTEVVCTAWGGDVTFPPHVAPKRALSLGTWWG